LAKLLKKESKIGRDRFETHQVARWWLPDPGLDAAGCF
jgi:hypothetical protein